MAPNASSDVVVMERARAQPQLLLDPEQMSALRSLADQPQPHRPLQLVTRKRSHRDVTDASGGKEDAVSSTDSMSTASSTVSMPHAPPLSPVVVEPQRWSTSTNSLSFLTSVDHIEINETVERNGVMYYVMDVFLFHCNSRLPTNINNPRRASASFSSSSSRSRVSSVSSTPDFRVERRYTDFARLRAQVRCWACMDAVVMCDYCNEIIKYTRFELRQPRFLVKLVTGVPARKKILASFINDFVTLAQLPNLRNHRCEAREHVPTLLESFLRD
jgi:hypothetical protein